jgi:hypothetical protein
LSVLVNISAALIAKVLSESVDNRCPLSLTKPIVQARYDFQGELHV